MSRTCWSIWWQQQHRNGSPLAFQFVFVFGRQVRAFIRGSLGLDWPYTPFTQSPHMYFTVVYVFRLVDDVFSIFDPLGPCCRSRRHRIWRRAPIISVLTPPLGHGGRLRCMWGLHVSLGHWGGGWSPSGSSCPLFNDFRADTTL